MSVKKGAHISGVRHLECIQERCNIDQDTGCWVWKWSCATNSNAPQTRYRGRTRTVRRVVLEMIDNPAPDNYRVLPRDSCSPMCVSPNHIQALNQSEFMHWMNRNTKMNGTAHSVARTIGMRNRKITKIKSLEEAERIRMRVASGEDRMALAAEFGITQDYLRRVVRGECWASKVAKVPASVWGFAATFASAV